MPSFVSNTSARRLVRQDEARKLPSRLSPQALTSSRRHTRLTQKLEGCDQTFGWFCGGTRRPGRSEQPSGTVSLQQVFLLSDKQTHWSLLFRSLRVRSRILRIQRITARPSPRFTVARSRSHGPSLDPPQLAAPSIAPAESALLRTQPSTPSALRVAKPTASRIARSQFV